MLKKLLGSILICLFLSIGCNQEEPPTRVDLSKKEQLGRKEEANLITYAYLPQYSHTVSYHRHHMLVEYLRKETGLNIRQVFPETFNKHMEMVGLGKVDISYSNPFVYVKIANRYNAIAFARVVESYGRENFRGQIICRSDNRLINRISDCRGKRWIAVSPYSGGGYLYPLGHFIAHGLKRTDFSVVDFAPGPGALQEKVVLAVYAGKYDIGTIREGTLNLVADRIDIKKIRVIADTRWYPGWVYAARADMEPEIVEKIKKAFLKLDYDQNEHNRILETADIIGIISSEDQDFDPVRELAAQVGISLQE